MCEHWIELFRHVVFAYSGTGMIMWFIKHSTVEYYLKRCKKKKNLITKINTVLVGTDQTLHEISGNDIISPIAKNINLSCLKKKSLKKKLCIKLTK